MDPSPPPYQDFKPPTWNPIEFCLIGAACALILLFSYYKIVKQHCRPHGASNRDRRRLLEEMNQDDSSLQFHSQGLDSSTKHSLPISQFKRNEGPSHSNTDCAVCLGEFEEGELLKHLPNCAHAFHLSCIDTWFQFHSNCPICRAHVCDLSTDHEDSFSMYSLLETLRREDFLQERAEHYQILRAGILQNPA